MKYDLFRQVDYNLLINDKIQQLQNDLLDLRRKTMTTNGVIDGILDKESKLQDATEEVDNDLNVLYSKRNVLSRRFQICEVCNTKLPSLAFQEHLKVCAFHSRCLGQEEAETNQDLSTKHHDNDKDDVVVKSQPPRNLRVSSIGSSSITIEWDDPLFNGGAPIIDYEIFYSKRGKRMNQKCTRWCNLHPVPENIYTIDGLAASTTYSNIKIRCKNKVGWSDFSAIIDNVKTKATTIQSCPQRFKVDKIAGTFIDLSWTPPFYMDGSQLESYELQYVEPIYEEEQDFSKGSKQARMEQRTITIEPQKTSHRLDNLRGGYTYLNFKLIARNLHGIPSIPVTCGDICTKQSSRADALRKELKWARSTIVNHIDSDFLTGVVQREDKQYYIKKLETELDSIEGKESDSCEKEASDSPSDDLGQNDSLIESGGVPIISLRSKQFQFRIKSIQESITAGHHEIELINSKRFFLSRRITVLEERVNEIKTELKRISDFDGQCFVASQVMHDSEQSFQVFELKSSLTKELITSSSQIETWKNEIVQGDGRMEVLLRMIEESKEKLLDRRTAFSLFQRKQRGSSILECKSNRTDEELMKMCIASWSKIAKESKKENHRILAISNYITSSIYRVALAKWKLYNSTFSKLETTKKLSTTITGKGGRCLLKTEIGRLETKFSIQDTLTSLKKNTSNAIFDDLYDLKAWNEHGLFGIVLGDHFFEEGDLTKAVDCYLALPQIVESLNVDQRIKLEYLNVIEFKIANASRVMGSYSKAFLFFESVLLRSIAIEDKRLTTLTHLGLGEVHTHMKEHVRAKEHFASALCVSSEDDSLLSLGLLAEKQLERYAFRDNMSRNSDFVAPSTQDLRETIVQELARADQLKSRLTYVGGLRLGFMTPIENASVSLVQIRMRKEDIKATIEQKEGELNHIREDIEKLPLLIRKIEEEIAETKSTNKRASSLVHDNPQFFRDQELREKLTLRLSESQVKFKQIQEKHNQLTIDIKNLRDEEYSLDEHARIEECPLMNKVLSRRKFRLMQFDKLGDSKSSSNNLVAVTIERDIYLHDLRSGKAMVVFTGGDSDQIINGHTKTITSLLFYGERIYSGSMDTSLICWNIAKKTLIFKSFGHNGTITSITIHDTLLFTGSVDKSVIVWNSHDGQMLKQLRGHSRGILGLTTWPSYFASADADGEILIWNQEYLCYKRLQLVPRNRVTVIRCGQQELVCGDSAGYISVFWLETENIIRQSKAHDSMVTDLSFDASKIVTCSTDGTVKVLDMLSCQILHTLRAGDSPIYSVNFDKIHIIFLSLDGKIQQWLWESTDERSQDGYKYHVVSEGDTTKTICKQYGLNMRQLLKMNPNQDLKNMKIGTRVLVAKPNSKNDTTKKNVRFDTGSKFRNAVIEPLENISPSEEDILRPNILAERTSLANRLIK